MTQLELEKQQIWDERFMRLAEGEPLSWSHIPGKEGGAAALVVSPNRRRFSIGYAGLPHDASTSLKNHCISHEATRDSYCRHAERNALSNIDCDVSTWTMYITAQPCLQCALEIHARRISRVVCRRLKPGSRWTVECAEAQLFLEEHGVDYILC